MSGGGGSGTGDEFGRAVARAAVAQALEAAGFDCAHRSAVDAVVDVLLRYISHLGRSAAFNANLAGRALVKELDVIQTVVGGWRQHRRVCVGLRPGCTTRHIQQGGSFFQASTHLMCLL